MYIKVKWIHEFSDEPVLFYSELDFNNYETRKIEIYKDGRYGYANDKIEFGGAKLGIVPVPTVEEIASDKQFEPKIITKNEFEKV